MAEMKIKFLSNLHLLIQVQEQLQFLAAIRKRSEFMETPFFLAVEQI